jgi:Fe-S-cluster containining protein
MRKKPSREELSKDANLCEYCSAKCCRYFALPIDTPEGWREFDFMRWYLLHEKATVFVDGGEWYLLVHSKCQFLRSDNLCGIYETRPDICRAYKTGKCEYEDRWVYDKYFETPEQIVEYAEAFLGPKKGKNIRSPKMKTK